MSRTARTPQVPCPGACAQPAPAPCAPRGWGSVPQSRLLGASINWSVILARIKLPAFFFLGLLVLELRFFFFSYLFTHPCFSLKYLISKCRPSLVIFFFHGNVESLCGRMLEVFIRRNHQELSIIQLKFM